MFYGQMLTIPQRRLDTETPFPHLLSLLRVCSPRQLDFPNIHRAARRIFEDAFPSNPEAFTHNHPLHEALPMAKSLNIPHVTKAIFYSLVSTTDFDVSGPPSHSGQDGSNTAQPRQGLSLDEQGSKRAPQSKIVPSKTLSPADSRTCLNLMNRLIDHFTPILFTPPATSHMECTDVFAETWMPLVIQPAIENDGVYKPLETLQRNKEIDWVKRGMCASCVAEKVEEWSEEQRSIWKMMDEWLELPSNSAAYS
ncbi:hypothetical protein JR316_0004049 [Psilocybe cubensis]|uniref:Uncharacterized protein n=2 Tax=Psilocybe cubensis TaxID=181762 RepID=A0A8H7Y663_PSICU|nr:hypothetical protein JR316_0004049 [Psilocybe cubensis]KAH9484567.1 hypothetical protein JR316_0004049 [Psilocybe cubensis]